MISANGNGFTSKQAVQDIVLLRAAEIGRKNGFSHSVILDGDDSRNVSSYTTPQTTTANVNCYGYGCTGNSYTSGGQSMPIVKHGSELRVLYLKDGVDSVPLDAIGVEFMWQQLAPKYIK